MNKLRLAFFLFATVAMVACNSDKKANHGAADTKDSTGNPNGKFLPYEKVLYPTGELQMAGKIVKGKRTGPWSSWFKNGNLNSEATFVNDKMHGPYQVWYENGNKRIQGRYEMDKQIGIWYFFTENGDTAKVIDYDKAAAVR